MRARLVLAVCLALGSVPFGSGVAFACSVGPGWDPVAATPVFALGRVVEIEVRRERPEGFLPAVVTLEVDAVLRGAVRGTLRFVDTSSAYLLRIPAGVERLEFAGSSGSCGALDGRPLGRYVAIALSRDADGTLRSNLLFGVTFASSARDPRLRWLLERHGVALPPSLRTAGPDAGQRFRFWGRADHELRIVPG
jgi:hypothetical protein